MNATAALSQETIDQFVDNAHGNLAVIKEFREKYPSIVSANASWNETAIETAAHTGRVEIVYYLLDHGADYDICTVAMLGSLNCLEDFLKEDPNLVNARGAHSIPILYYPVIRGNADVAEYLLQHGADPNAASPSGISPFMVQSCLTSQKWHSGCSTMVWIRIRNMTAKRHWQWRLRKSKLSWSIYYFPLVGAIELGAYPCNIVIQQLAVRWA